jgi:glutamine synthetase
LRVVDLQDLAKEFSTVIVAATDVQGRLFGRRVPVDRFLNELKDGIDICTCALAWDIAQDLSRTTEFEGGRRGWNDFRIIPALETLRRYPGAADTAICMADVVDEDGEALVEAPRTILRHQLDRAEQAGYGVVLASELEFYLFHGGSRQLRKDDFRSLEPTTLVRSDYSIVGQGVQEPFIGRVRREMDAAGIEIYACQAEYGLGQWEVNFAHSDALEMADRHVIYKAALKELALAQDLSVTFMARPLSGDVGSSCHLHCSLWEGGSPVFASDQPRRLSGRGKHFVGGLLEHIDETAIFCAPYVNSYKRHLPDDFGGGVKAWGYDNRTIAVRVVGHGGGLHVELRYPGADVNPYLAAAAMIAAGLDGIERGLDPGEPYLMNAYETENQLGKTPRSLAEALECFRASRFVSGVFGEKVAAHYAAHAEAEWLGYLKAVTDWELRRAFELV